MSAEPPRDLSAFGPQRGEARLPAFWSAERPRQTIDLTPVDGRLARLKRFLPHVALLSLALVAGAGAATFATAPAMTDGVEELAGLSAIDARQMGLALAIDPTGETKKQAAIGRDVGAMKSEIARLQRALDQSKANQTAATRSAAGQAAGAQEEVKALKAELASLQKNLETTREAAAAKLDALASKVDQPKPSEDAANLAELRERLDRIETAPREVAAAVPAPRAKPVEDPESTGALGPNAGGAVVKNWAVRDVYDGFALIEGRQGLIEVAPGAPIPGAGRVRAIEKRSGQWVVVTDRGVILQRP